MQAIQTVLETKTALDAGTIAMLAARIWEVANKVERSEDEQLLAQWFHKLYLQTL